MKLPRSAPPQTTHLRLSSIGDRAVMEARRPAGSSAALASCLVMAIVRQVHKLGSGTGFHTICQLWLCTASPLRGFSCPRSQAGRS